MHGSCSPNQRFGQLLRRCLRKEADELYRLFERSESHSFTLVIRTKVKSGFLPSVGQLIQFLSHRSVTAPFPKRSLGNRLLIFYSILFRHTEGSGAIRSLFCFQLVDRRRPIATKNRRCGRAAVRHDGSNHTLV